MALSLTRHLGGKTMTALLQHFNDDVVAILAADEDTLREVPRIGAKIAEAIRQIAAQSISADLYNDEKRSIYPCDENVPPCARVIPAYEPTCPFA